MVKLVLLCYVVVLGACVHTTPNTFADKVEYYKKEFYKDFPYATPSQIFVERTIGVYLHGRCMPDAKVSIVNPYSTLGFTDGQIQFLVYHELGHCALDLPHDTITTVMGSNPFPRKFNVQDVIEMREYHRQVCRGNPPGVRKQVFGPKELTHESCFHGALVGED